VKEEEIIAIIPARGGSKGLPNKNILNIEGLPLIAHTILDAMESQYITSTYVSTDSLHIKEVAIKYGAKIIDRPETLASDTATSESALIHALLYLESIGHNPDLIVFLQCTSPIRTGKDIDQSILKLKETHADSLLSASPSHRFLWEENNGAAVAINFDYKSRPRRQDMKHQYIENGSIYVFKPWVLKELNNRLGGKIALYCMSEEASFEIDSQLDLQIVELLLKNQGEDVCF